jgi:hypothetical protein
MGGRHLHQSKRRQRETRANSAHGSNLCRSIKYDYLSWTWKSERQEILLFTFDPRRSQACTLFSICQKEWFARVWVFQELVFAPNPWVQWGRARSKWATVLERGFSSYLNISGKTLPRCSNIGQSNTYTLRKLPCFSLYKQGEPSVCLINEI